MGTVGKDKSVSYIPDFQDLSRVSGCFLSLTWANRAFLKVGVMCYSVFYPLKCSDASILVDFHVAFFS